MTSQHSVIAPPTEVSISVHAAALDVLNGLVRNHFGKRSRGRPRQNSEVSRIKAGVRKMLRASGVAATPALELALLTQLLNRSLFDRS
jgi:hypothetical protein